MEMMTPGGTSQARLDALNDAETLRKFTRSQFRGFAGSRGRRPLRARPLPDHREDAMTALRNDTREAWLMRASRVLLDEFLGPVDKGAAKVKFCVSVGFPKGRHGRGRAVGQCWSPVLARDGKAHIFVSPERDGSQAAAVLATVLHELVHAIDKCEHGHKGPFAKTALAVGLQKPLTSSPPNEALAARLNALSVRLGPFPHGALRTVDRARAGSRLRLWECECPVKVRVARDEFNATCGDCEQPFERKDAPPRRRKKGGPM